MPKVAINKCFGGFSLSKEAVYKLAEKKGLTLYESNVYSFPMYYTSPNFTEASYFDGERPEKRDDPDLIAVIEELGERADGRSANLKIVEVPDDVDWYIHDYDGVETVYEKHRSWG